MVFFFNDTATTEIYTLSLHDALPISEEAEHALRRALGDPTLRLLLWDGEYRSYVDANRQPYDLPEETETCVTTDRKSTRLNSSHANISYAVFCLKKKKNTNRPTNTHV